jgi:hypothetical protein
MVGLAESEIEMPFPTWIDRKEGKLESKMGDELDK